MRLIPSPMSFLLIAIQPGASARALPILPILSLLPPLSLLMIVIGCAGPRMVPPAELSQGQRLDVPKRSFATGVFVNEAFDLGPYHVTHVDRKSVKQSGANLGGYVTGSITTGYSYRFEGGEGGKPAWKGSCAFMEREKGFSSGGTSFTWAKSNLACECSDGQSKGRVELKSDQGKPTGVLAVSGQTYPVIPVTTMDKKLYGAAPAGFRANEGDSAVAAVEVLRPGQVWLGEKLPEAARDPTACVFTGLMLYVEPTEH